MKVLKGKRTYSLPHFDELREACIDQRETKGPLIMLCQINSEQMLALLGDEDKNSLVGVPDLFAILNGREKQIIFWPLPKQDYIVDLHVINRSIL